MASTDFGTRPVRVDVSGNDPVFVIERYLRTGALKRKNFEKCKISDRTPIH
jgi:hypothetical protein